MHNFAQPRGLVNINDIPFFYDDMAAFEHRIVYYESSRGCPYRCSYCLSSIDKTVRLRDLELVKKELQFFLDLKIPQVKFIDRTFNCNRDHACEVWKYIHENDNGITKTLENVKGVNLLNGIKFLSHFMISRYRAVNITIAFTIGLPFTFLFGLGYLGYFVNKTVIQPLRIKNEATKNSKNPNELSK